MIMESLKRKLPGKQFYLLAVVFLTTVSTLAEVNLFSNGDFEDDNVSRNLIKSDCVRIIEGVGHSGKKLLAIAGPLSHKKVFWEDIKLKGGTHYEISFWYRTGKNYKKDGSKVFKPEQIFRICPYSGDKKIRIFGATKLYPSKKWQKEAAYFYIPKDCETSINFRIQVPWGEYFIDDIVLKEVNDKMFKKNLMRNGDFERGIFPHGWTLNNFYQKKSAPLPVCLMDDDGGFYEGERSLRIDCKKGDVFLLRYNFLPARNGKTYKFSFWMRSEKEQLLKLSVSSFSGEKVQHLYKYTNIKIGQNWQKYNLKFTVPGNSDSKYYNKSRTALNFGITNGYSKESTPGSIWLDKVEAYEVQD